MMSVQMMEQLKATARANVTICVFDTGNYHQPTWDSAIESNVLKLFQWVLMGFNAI